MKAREDGVPKHHRDRVGRFIPDDALPPTFRRTKNAGFAHFLRTTAPHARRSRRSFFANVHLRRHARRALLDLRGIPRKDPTGHGATGGSGHAFQIRAAPFVDCERGARNRRSRALGKFRFRTEFSASVVTKQPDITVARKRELSYNSGCFRHWRLSAPLRNGRRETDMGQRLYVGNLSVDTRRRRFAPSSPSG